MANQLKMATKDSIRVYKAQGKSNRWIARELGIDRETVARHVGLLDSNPAISTAGNNDSKPAILTPGKAGRKSQCEEFKSLIESKVELGFSAQRIYQDLVLESAFAGSYQAVKRFTRSFKKGHPEKVFRMECEPGEEAQVDFGVGAPVLLEGKRKRTWVFRVSLSFSRKAYSEVVCRQTTEVFVRCLENAFRYFGGVPKTLCVDNLKAAVIRADWWEPELNPKLREFCQHYGTVILPTRPYRPEHKGKIESGIKYVKNNALKGRTFVSLEEQNRFLLEWEKTVADCRIHGTTRKQVQGLFEEAERTALLPLAPMFFAFYHEAQRTVHRDSFVEVEKAYYEVPQEYIGRKVWVRWDGKTVRILNHRLEQLRIHPRIAAGKFTKFLGIGGGNGSVEHSCKYWAGRALELGTGCGAWAEELLKERGPEAIRVLMGLQALAKNHSLRSLNEACQTAVSHGALRLKDIRRLLEQPCTQGSLDFAEAHPLIRPLSEYEDFLKNYKMA